MIAPCESTKWRPLLRLTQQNRLVRIQPLGLDSPISTSTNSTTLPLEMPSALQGPQSYSHRATSLRSQEPQLHTRDLPTRLGGRGRTRFDNGISQMNREAEAMEVEEYPVSRPIQVPSGINSERAPLSPTVPPNGTPTGPRAMSLNLSNVATALPPQEDNRQRAVMPHNRPNTFTAHSPLLTSDEANIQSYDYRKDRVSSQSGPKNTEQRDIPPRSSRWGEPSAQNTGSNTAPPRAGRPPGGQHAPDLNPTHVAERPRYHQGPSEFSERSRFDKDHDKPSTRSSSYKSTSPVDRLKVLPVVNEAGTRWPGREEAHKTMDDSPALPSRPALNERDADQSGMHKGVDKSARPTRFGPERTQSVAAADNEPRQWLTREEAARSGLVQPTSHTRGPNVAPVPTSRHPGRRVDMEHTKYGNEAAYSPTEQRTPVQPPPDAVAFRRNEGREDIRRDRRSSVVERPSLEGRLSSTRDRDRVSHDDRQPDRSSNGYDDQGRFATHPHPERTRSMAPPPTTDPEMFDGRANAIKNRRKARPSEQNGGSGFPRDSDRDAPYIVDSDSGTAPPRRGGSLLDRLTEPTHDVSGPPPSLRQRVDGPLTGIAGLPARPPAEVTLNAINATELKTPRRKPKKGVRRG
ncbi:hypothetical protein BDW22DRAFT_299545 [Trametopsis cervina]|nr:hypothetical protein BDW22DRAFT_299545 [Trametopsis cervina]